MRTLLFVLWLIAAFSSCEPDTNPRYRCDMICAPVCERCVSECLK
jgi:hypothetical protein